MNSVRRTSSFSLPAAFRINSFVSINIPVPGVSPADSVRVVMVPVAARAMMSMSMDAAFARAVPELLDHRGLHAQCALDLESGVGDMVFVKQNLLDVTQNFRLIPLVFRIDVDMRGEGQDMG